MYFYGPLHKDEQSYGDQLEPIYNLSKILAESNGRLGK